MRNLFILSMLAMVTCLFVSPVQAAKSASKEECVVKCREAAAMINAKGLEQAVEVISDPNSSFVWKDSYVFLMDMHGKMIAHPFKPELTKKEHCLLITDPTGKALFVDFVNIARSQQEGWVEYMWPKPLKNTPRKKLTYIYRVPGEELFVGAGVYVGGMMY
ncbi:MAG: cache domain-containing protein [Desulfobacteraceae bacterium]